MRTVPGLRRSPSLAGMVLCAAAGVQPTRRVSVLPLPAPTRPPRCLFPQCRCWAAGGFGDVHGPAIQARCSSDRPPACRGLPQLGQVAAAEPRSLPGANEPPPRRPPCRGRTSARRAWNGPSVGTKGGTGPREPAWSFGVPSAWQARGGPALPWNHSPNASSGSSLADGEGVRGQPIGVAHAGTQPAPSPPPLPALQNGCSHMQPRCS